MREIPDGVISMMVTPMHTAESEDGEYKEEDVNFPAFYDEIDWCSTNGAKGVVVTPSIGEFATLKEWERVECLETCAEYLREHHLNLFRIAGITDTSTRSAKFYAKLALDLGYDAGQMNPPYYWTQNEETLYRHYAKVAEVGLPLVVYNNPSLSKFDMNAKFMARLAKIPGVIAIKEVKTDRHKEFAPLIEEVRAVNPAIKIYTTYRAFFDGILWGANGAFANVQTTPFCAKMWDLAKSDPQWTKGHLNRIKAIQDALEKTFPRGGEDNPHHIATTKLYASLVTSINMGNAREPDAFPPDFPIAKLESRLRSKLQDLYELIK